MDSLARAEILAKTREAFGNTVLGKVTDAKAFKYYTTLKRLLDSGVPGPYAKMVKLVQNWNELKGQISPSYLKMLVYEVSRKLFGDLETLRKEQYKANPALAKKPPKPKTPKEEIRWEKEQTRQQEETEKFDPLQETIRATVAFRAEFEHWSKLARDTEGITDIAGIIKAGNLWRESIKDSVELFQKLKIIDDGAIEKIRERVSIGTIQVLINQGVPNPQQTGGLLDRFLSEVGTLAIEAGTQELQHASELHSEVGESRPGDSAPVEVGEAGGDESLGTESD
jgi:hypothetical protein